MGELATRNRKKTSNQRSILLNNAENEDLFRMLGSDCCTLSSGVVQLLKSNHPENTKWDIQFSGVACFVKDYQKMSYFIRMYNIKKKNMIWEHELYKRFKFNTPRDFFLTFESDTCQVGLNFASEDEADHFRKALIALLTHRKQRQLTRKNKKIMTAHPTNNASPGGASSQEVPLAVPTPEPVLNGGQPKVGPRITSPVPLKNRSKKGTKIDRKDISSPFDFRVVNSVRFEPDTGFNMDGLEEDMKKLLQAIGISAEDKVDMPTLRFVVDFINKNGGIQAVRKAMTGIPVSTPSASKTQNPTPNCGRPSSEQPRPKLPPSRNQLPLPPLPPKLASNNSSKNFAAPLPPNHSNITLEPQSSKTAPTRPLPPTPITDMMPLNKNQSHRPPHTRPPPIEVAGTSSRDGFGSFSSETRSNSNPLCHDQHMPSPSLPISDTRDTFQNHSFKPLSKNSRPSAPLPPPPPKTVSLSSENPSQSVHASSDTKRCPNPTGHHVSNLSQDHQTLNGSSIPPAPHMLPLPCTPQDTTEDIRRSSAQFPPPPSPPPPPPPPPLPEVLTSDDVPGSEPVDDNVPQNNLSALLKEIVKSKKLNPVDKINDKEKEKPCAAEGSILFQLQDALDKMRPRIQPDSDDEDDSDEDDDFNFDEDPSEFVM